MNKKTTFIKLLILTVVLQAPSLIAQQPQKIINLWDGNPPNSIKNSQFNEIIELKDSVINRIEQVSQPTLTVFEPEKPNGTGIIIFPGGGYHHLSINKEGYKVAKWLNEMGITAFVLKYRLPNDAIMKDKNIGPLEDAQKAISYVRSNSEKWYLNNSKIGVIGFSAGGHLAALLSNSFLAKKGYDNGGENVYPNFSILVYPVISMQDDICHLGSRNNLLGSTPSKEKIEIFSNELHVDSLTPKTFLVHAADDKSVPVNNSIDYCLALLKHNVSVEMHIYEKGGHGFGLGRNEIKHAWTLACINWLICNELTYPN